MLKNFIYISLILFNSSIAFGIDLPFDVYTDYNAQDNHYVPSGWMGDVGAITLNQNCKENTHSGKFCIKIVYSGESTNGQGWIGIYWQNPANNWGNSRGGYNLTGSQTLEIRARSEKDGSIVEFKMGGIEGDFPDTHTGATGPVTLTKEWKKYTIDLSGADLSYISGGFCLTMTQINNPNGVVIYLDDIRYVK